MTSGWKSIGIFITLTAFSLLYFFRYIQLDEVTQPNDEWFDPSHLYTNEQRERLHTLKSYCIKNGRTYNAKTLSQYSRKALNFRVRGTPKGTMFATRKKKAMYCSVPKAASTNWKRMLLVMEGVKDLNQLAKKFKVHTQPDLISLASMSVGERDQVLTKYYKFLFVRHPFERIVSAYRNKLADNNTFFERTYGTRILRFSRTNLTEQQYEEGKDTTFEEFARWVAHKKPYDPHWIPVLQLCRPCVVPYMFIGKMETLYKDAEQVMEHLKSTAKFPVSWNDGYKTSSRTLMKGYFSTMSNETIRSLYGYYKDDFEAFGYY